MITRTTSPHFSVYHMVAIGLAFFAFYMSALVSQNVFERLPHLEDEVAYQFQAEIFARGQMVIPSPEPRRAFWQPFIVDHDNAVGQKVRFSKYTPGWSMVLALGEVMGQGWVINALFAMLSVALVFRLGSEIFNQDVGIIASALTAFSPAALLLNGSLMAHTTALFYGLLFTYAYWRLEKGRNGYRWASVAGIALGCMVVTRPAPAVALAMPFVVWTLARLLKQVSQAPMWRTGFADVLQTVRPYLVLTVFALALSSLIYIYNYQATGNPRANLYTFVWSYDQIGFGECCGRSGHTLEKAFRHARFDMSLAAADLFGWQVNGWSGGQMPISLRAYLVTEGSYWQPIGVSFVLLPFGIVVGLLHGVRRRRDGLKRVVWLGAWLVGAVAWCVLPVTVMPPELITNPITAWGWIILGLGWLLLPILALVRRPLSSQVVYTGLFVAVAGCLVVFQMTYWVGSQRYSTRYWYECLGVLAILSAIPLAWLMRNFFLKTVVYGVLVLALTYSLFNYSIPRVSALYQFNNVTQAYIDAVYAHRVDDRPILVIVNGDTTGDNRVLWRAYGALMAATSPFLDTDIVVARVYSGDETMRQQVLAKFPNRQVIDMYARGTDNQFIASP